MAFPRIYDDVTCPLEGYEGYSFRVLLNPTGREKTDWIEGNLGAVDCAECARLGVQTGKSKAPVTSEPTVSEGGRVSYAGVKVYCPACQAAREQMARAWVAIYGTSHADGMSFATPAQALATIEQPDLPDEMLRWLWRLPVSLWVARVEDLEKKLNSSLTSLS